MLIIRGEIWRRALKYIYIKKIDFLKNKSRKAIFLSFLSVYTTLVWKNSIFVYFKALRSFSIVKGLRKLSEAATRGVLFLKNLSKFTGKQLCLTVTLLKKRLWHRCFLWILQNFYEHLFYKTTASHLLKVLAILISRWMKISWFQMILTVQKVSIIQKISSDRCHARSGTY